MRTSIVSHKLSEFSPKRMMEALPDQPSYLGITPIIKINFFASLLLMLSVKSGSHWILKFCSHFLNPYEPQKKRHPFWKLWKSSKKDIPSNMLFLHNKAFIFLETYVKLAQEIDSENFSQKEFVLLAKLRFKFKNKAIDNHSFSSGLEKLQTALQVQKLYQLINQIESSYSSSVQQEFYCFVNQILSSQLNLSDIHQQIRQKWTELLPQIKIKSGKKLLQTYLEAIYQLLNFKDSQFALTLFSAFQQHHLEQYTLLQKFSDLIMNLNQSEMMNFKSLLCLVMVHYDTFEQVGQLICIRDKDSCPETYAKMIQYLALSNYYQASFSKFEQLINILQQWYSFYQAVQQIRQEYPPTHFNQPIEFQQAIPGLSLYLKYQDYLENSNQLPVGVNGDSLRALLDFVALRERLRRCFAVRR